MLKKILERYIEVNNNIFRELICNLSIFQIGDDNLSAIDKSTLIFPQISAQIQIEPFPIEALIVYKRNYPDFIIEVYHNKLVSEWQNLLDEVFNYLLDLHFKGKRQFTELGKTNVSLSFGDKRETIDQIIENLRMDFTFLSYEKRIKVINDSFNCLSPQRNNLNNILKNVLIRNTIQHRNSTIDEYLLKKIGVDEIVILNKDGNEETLKAGDKVSITLAQMFDFKKSLIFTIHYCPVKNSRLITGSHRTNYKGYYYC